MMKFTSISWYFFFLSVVVILLVWLFTSRTKLGRSFIQLKTPWSLDQWFRVLLVVCLTLFILVNPVFHLLTAAVLLGLYYLFVGNNFLTVVKQSGWNTREKPLGFSTRLKHEMITLTCTGKDDQTMVSERSALYRCLFSFPFILEENTPSVQYLDGKYEVILRLSDEQYLSSLLDYIRSAGFDINYKINK